MARFRERYLAGDVPWDHELPPPEVVATVDGLAPGRALDLGCGYGRTAIYLAGRGWRVDGVDFIPEAVAGARERAATAGVGDRCAFHEAPVTDLGFLDGRYDLAVDVGCLHSLAEAGLRAYHRHLVRLLGPEGLFLLFAHLQEAGEDAADGRRWLEEAMLRAVFAVGFALDDVEHGTTQVRDKPAWPSAWFRFLRIEDGEAATGV